MARILMVVAAMCMLGALGAAEALAPPLTLTSSPSLLAPRLLPLSSDSLLSALEQAKHAGFNHGAILALRGGNDDEDGDLFADGDEETTAAAEELKKKAEAAKAKSSGGRGPAKTAVVIDVKGLDENTDFQEVEKSAREIKMEGLLWGESHLVSIGYGLQKLRITVVVEDDKVSIDDLEETLGEISGVQSVDIVSMNKI
ncbi:hypothetical protein GUITHDRAFT_154358 [Guillardia theta CCMP2712]|uniref:Translation elongation factor EF1B beta/delta subunit guanine nucleotide exchange domain-containing protein n=2 Tax=Guillardia theta TaxID=55529 RepID=L1IV29_GUITC|nr:hypothetical protein GUITHDRAFT_154358 [Guillardia theta CCMP2712]EKX39739.1 hypothetical protein GUITHDRAFT_154358 [Guillardia theta CCMP2712]|eukprot:XP_005826719.1 hypothetical protein GUITHDRAFT_154358 [Guillardia theta CCMP2712]